MQCYSHRIVITRLLQDRPFHLQKHLDEEFPPEAIMLFKDDIINYLLLEDIAVTAGFITGRLIEANKKLL